MPENAKPLDRSVLDLVRHEVSCAKSALQELELAWAKLVLDLIGNSTAPDEKYIRDLMNVISDIQVMECTFNGYQRTPLTDITVVRQRINNANLVAARRTKVKTKGLEGPKIRARRPREDQDLKIVRKGTNRASRGAHVHRG